MTSKIIVREYKPGDPSLVAHLNMVLYQKHYGFKGIFEYYLVKGLAEFLENPDGSQLWVAEIDSTIAGSIAIVKKSEQSAQLRWFAVEASVQGMGIGSKLMDKAMQFCEGSGYTEISLWTIDILHAARHIYHKHGFVLTQTQENTEWTDHVLIEEKWEKIRKASSKSDL